MANLLVLDVVPHPGVTRLLALVLPATQDAAFNARDVKEALARERGNLRAALAAAINRKRTPMIAFELL